MLNYISKTVFKNLNFFSESAPAQVVADSTVLCTYIHLYILTPPFLYSYICTYVHMYICTYIHTNPCCFKSARAQAVADSTVLDLLLLAQVCHIITLYHIIITLYHIIITLYHIICYSLPRCPYTCHTRHTLGFSLIGFSLIGFRLIVSSFDCQRVTSSTLYHMITLYTHTCLV